MYAAAERPDLFCALALIEPVFLPPTIIEQLLRDPSLNHIAATAQNRQSRWASRQAAFDRFRAKPIFARWSDESLWDYLDHGIVATERGQVRLAYSPEWEAQIYSLVPADVWSYVPRISQPTLALRGAESDTLGPAAWQLWQELQPQAHFVAIEGAGHLVPMEQPEAVARAIITFGQAMAPVANKMT
jgi:pimeloyl-ACP methyl ester carboxylesterase